MYEIGLYSKDRLVFALGWFSDEENRSPVAHKDGEKSKAFIENPPHVFLTQQQTMTADLLQL